MGASAWTKSLRAWKKVRLKYRLYHQLGCHLYHTVLEDRNAKWPFIGLSRFVDPASFHGLGTVCAGVKL
jgi:hypothetical protein